jgi:cytoskeletal protein RodZ
MKLLLSILIVLILVNESFASSLMPRDEVVRILREHRRNKIGFDVLEEVKGNLNELFPERKNSKKTKATTETEKAYEIVTIEEDSTTEILTPKESTTKEKLEIKKNSTTTEIPLTTKKTTTVSPSPLPSTSKNQSSTPNPSVAIETSTTVRPKPVLDALPEVSSRSEAPNEELSDEFF